MRYAYPCDIVRDPESAKEAYVVSFPDVYGANTGGWSWEEALELAEDALAVALAGYVRCNEEIPTPSAVADGQVLIPVPVVVAAKLVLYSAIREQGIASVDLANQLNVSDDAIRRLVDPRYRSHISQVEKALCAVGQTLVVEGRKRPRAD